MHVDPSAVARQVNGASQVPRSHGPKRPPSRPHPRSPNGLVVDEVTSVPEVDGDVVVPVPVVVALSPVVESPVVVVAVDDETADVEVVVASVLVVEAPEVVSSTLVVDEVGDPLL
jgi:hypothetical protein